jgi:hypothetical protein
MHWIPSCQGKLSSATQGIAHTLCKPEVHHRVHNSPIFLPNLTTKTPVRTPILSICRISTFILQFHPSLGFPSVLSNQSMFHSYNTTYISSIHMWHLWLGLQHTAPTPRRKKPKTIFFFNFFFSKFVLWLIIDTKFIPDHFPFVLNMYQWTYVILRKGIGLRKRRRTNPINALLQRKCLNQ